jgi:hypothetical protein
MDRLASRDLALDGIEKADEFEVAVGLHAAADYRAVEHAERGEQGSGAVPLVIVRIKIRGSRTKAGRSRSAVSRMSGSQRLAAGASRIRTVGPA